MAVSVSEETNRIDPHGTPEPDLDALFRELDEEAVRGVDGRQHGFRDAAGPVVPGRPEGSFRSRRGGVADRAGPVLMVTGIALIAGAFLALGISLSLFLALNLASLLLIGLGLLLLPNGSARR